MRTGLVMFLTCCPPRSSKARSRRSRTCSCAAALRQIPPGSDVQRLPRSRIPPELDPNLMVSALGGFINAHRIFTPRRTGVRLRDKRSRPNIEATNLGLTCAKAGALAQELAGIIDSARYPLSPQIRTLRAVLGKLRPEPSRAACRRRGSRPREGDIKGGGEALQERFARAPRKHGDHILDYTWSSHRGAAKDFAPDGPDISTDAAAGEGHHPRVVFEGVSFCVNIARVGNFPRSSALLGGGLWL